MIEEYVNKLIDNLPNEIKTQSEPIIVDIVLDGGAFNGSYLVGALYFLKEMEKRNYIKIERISGCSIGSVVGFFYFINALEFMPELYNIATKHLKKNYNLETIKELKVLLKDRIPENICDIIKNKLFISYNNIKENNKIIKSEYKNVDDIFNTIIKSSFIPYLIDGNILYNKKYVDGITPYVFKVEKDRKILYLDLFGYDKMWNIFNVKNEKNNFHRILSGLLDIHNFYIKQSQTAMCSYVNDWSLYNKTCFYGKLLFEKVVIIIINILLYIKVKIPDEFKDSVLSKMMLKIIKVIFITMIENYCL